MSQGSVSLSASLSPPYSEASDNSLPDSPPQFDSKCDSCCAEGKLEIPNLQHNKLMTHIYKETLNHSLNSTSTKRFKKRKQWPLRKLGKHGRKSDMSP